MKMAHGIYKSYAEFTLLIPKFQRDALNALERAEWVAAKYSHAVIGPEHLLRALLTQKRGNEVLGTLRMIRSMDIPRHISLVERLLESMPASGEPSSYSADLIQVVRNAERLAKDVLRHNIIYAAAFYCALLEVELLPIQNIFKEEKITVKTFCAVYVPGYG
jgi:ATP-dependent Clp protease ATP-binding subunit ClpA